MDNNKRLISAYLIAPLVPSILIVFFDGIFSHENERHLSTVIMILFSLPLSYVFCLIGGWFVIYLLKCINYLYIWSLVASGFLLGAVAWYLIGYLLAYLFGYTKEILPATHEIMGGGVLGVTVALPFGLIAGIPWYRKQKN